MKQTENIKRLQWVQAEAKKLKAKNKKLTHIEALKKAWDIWYKKLVTKAPDKKIGAVKKKAAPKKKAAKKAAPKKTATKKACNHKDTNSHNVRVSVISGIDNKKVHNTIHDLDSIIKNAEHRLKAFVTMKDKKHAATERTLIRKAKVSKKHLLDSLK